MERSGAAPSLLAFALLGGSLVALSFGEGRVLFSSLAVSLSEDPIDCALLLVAAAVLASWLEHKVVALVCIAAGLALAGIAAAIILGSSAHLAPAGLTPLVAAVLLAGALLVCELHVPQARRLVLSATLALMSSALSAIVLLLCAGLIEEAASVDVRLTGRALGCLTLGIAWLDHLFHRGSASAELALAQLPAPIAGVGVVSSAAVVWLLQDSTLDPARRWAVAVPIVAILLLLAGAASAGVRIGASVLALRSQNRKHERLLKRQRRLMQARTAALRNSRTHYEALFNNVPLPVVLASPEGDVFTANPALLDLLGVSEEELKGLNFEQFYDDPSDRRKLVAYWDVSRRDVHRGELTLRRRDGERLNVLYANRTVRSSDGTIEYLQGMFTDITELRKAEAQHRALESHLRLSQKLEAVGRLAAGVAHEINTPMQYIGDNVYFLREAFESLRELLTRERRLVESSVDRRGRELLDAFESLECELGIDEIVEVAPRAFDRTQEGIKTVSSIVAAMKELAHPGQGAKVPTDVNAVIETALAVTRNEYKTVAEVMTLFGDLPAIPAYKNELCQVLINLIVNAAHAIESAHKEGAQPGLIRIETRAEAGGVAIAVRDNGCGIPEAAREKIFDPFFTTKEVGKGTGQGLALARATIVDKHQGEISVDSEVGVQTTFTIRLPMERLESQTTEIRSR